MTTYFPNTRFKNTTEWETSAIAELIQRAMKYRGLDTSQVDEIRVEYTNSTSRSYTGRASLGGTISGYGRFIYLGVPNYNEVASFDKKRFLQVALHEIDHRLGLTHDEMLRSSKLSIPEHGDVTVRWTGEVRDDDEWMEGPQHRRVSFEEPRELNTWIWEEAEVGDKVLFNDRKRPLEVVYTEFYDNVNKGGVILEGPQGGRYGLLSQNRIVTLYRNPEKEFFPPVDVPSSAKVSLKWFKVVE